MQDARGAAPFVMPPPNRQVFTNVGQAMQDARGAAPFVMPPLADPRGTVILESDTESESDDEADPRGTVILESESESETESD